jgi:hypothetical protein
MCYLTLPSNSSMDYLPETRLTHFTTRLPQMVDLDRLCEIGLAEIQYKYPKQLLNSAVHKVLFSDSTVRL